MPFIPGAKKALQRFVMAEANLNKQLDCDWLMGSAILVRKEAIVTVGAMDERFFHYMSDVDWARRFWENGWRVTYLPSVQIYHYLKRESKGKLGVLDIFYKRNSQWHLMDFIKYLLKHGLSNKRPCIKSTKQE